MTPTVGDRLVIDGCLLVCVELIPAKARAVFERAPGETHKKALLTASTNELVFAEDLADGAGACYLPRRVMDRSGLPVDVQKLIDAHDLMATGRDDLAFAAVLATLQAPTEG